MAYNRRFHRHATPQSRDMHLKRDGQCYSCGAVIRAGELATYWPAGALGAGKPAAVSHAGGPDGNSAKCAAAIRERLGVNDYAGDGVDLRFEDDCADICGR